MMSEKRFRITTNPKSNAVAFDEQQKKHYIGIDFEDLLNEQQSKINAMEKENDELKKQVEDCKDYNSKLYANCLQKDRGWIKRVKRLEAELEECIKENVKLRELVYIDDE